MDQTLVLGSPAPAHPLPAASTSAPAPNSQARFYVPALDGLRLFAFLGVWAFHAFSSCLPLPGDSWRSALAYTGMYGVPLFFVLSAFLITRLLVLERERNGKVDLRAYYARRTLRIWPLYVLVATVGLTILAHQGHPITADALHLMTFTANWPTTPPELIGPLWSLSVEEQFYLVWPLVLALVPARRLAPLCYGMIAAALVARCAIVHHTGLWPMMWSSTLGHLDSLALGTLLALNVHRIPCVSRAQWGVLSALCLAGMVVLMHTFPVGPSLKLALSYTAIPFLCVAIVALAIGSRGTMLARPKVAAMGRLTFGLYCWHMIPMVLIRPKTPLEFVACFLSAWALAAVSYYAYERPFLSLKHRFQRVQTRPA